MIPDNSTLKSSMSLRYEEILSQIQPIGNLVAKKYNDDKKEELLFAHDILMRIFKNIKVLKSLGVSNDTAPAYRMILRSMFADLIEGLTLLTCDEQYRIDEFYKKNLAALNTFESWVKSKNNFFRLINKDGKETMDLQMLYNSNPEYVDCITSEFIKPNRNNHLSKKSIGALCDKLTKVNVNLFSFFDQLYINYKYLSLTEHYHVISRRHSYHYDEDFLLYPDFLGWVSLGVKTLCEVIGERIETGTFVITDNSK